MNYDNIISFISSLNIVDKKTLIVACGSALVKENPDDVDFIIYTKNKEKFLSKLKIKLQNKQIDFKDVFIDKLNIYSIKFKHENRMLSFLIVNNKHIMSYLQKHTDSNIYTDINVFEFEFCYPLIYRKWIVETKYLIGNKQQYDLFIKITSTLQIPKQSITICRDKILNTLKYLKRKQKTSVLAKSIIQNELANNLILYLYALNNKLIGTVPYIEKDLLSFEKGKELANIAIQLIYNKCETNSDDILKLVEEQYETI